ncbi:inorganic diphosphatase [Jejudonia soesokkakensis]|uniref:inorganic diphosphatase n=1 Tax=Jejudonia soesokkakensis TaxID=1323432 RepID=A0ABW2MP59_9FLAO
MQKNYLYEPTFVTSETINVVIEIPAGTNKKIEYHKTSKQFLVDKMEGVDRIKPYLPYPANYGFVPSTLSDPAIGGDGDPIDVMLIAETLPSGTIIEAIPVAMLRLVDEGETDDKVICIPANKKLRTVDASSLAEMNTKYPKALEIIRLWFEFNDAEESIAVKGYVDASEAIQEIKICQKAFQIKN